MSQFTKQDLINVYGNNEMVFKSYAKKEFVFESTYSQGRIEGTSRRLHTLEITGPTPLRDLIPFLDEVRFYSESGELVNTIELTNQE